MVPALTRRYILPQGLVLVVLHLHGELPTTGWAAGWPLAMVSVNCQSRDLQRQCTVLVDLRSPPRTFLGWGGELWGAPRFSLCFCSPPHTFLGWEGELWGASWFSLCWFSLCSRGSSCWRGSWGAPWFSHCWHGIGSSSSTYVDSDSPCDGTRGCVT